MNRIIIPVIIIVCIYFIITPMSKVLGATAWKIDSQKSELIFTAIVNSSPIEGHFKIFSGDIVFDPQDLDNSSANIVIDMNSVFATKSEIAPNLIKKEWFNAKDYPQAVFRADKFIHGDKEKTYQVSGTLTIRDKTLPITLTFSLNEYSKTNAMVTGGVFINRLSFDIGTGEWADTEFVQDKVIVQFKITATPKENAKP